MVCTANDLLGWKDFPKGLRVLFLDEDQDYASEVKAKLEEMDCVVSVFSSEEEALLAISSKADNYHVAIVEVNAKNSNGRYKFLESAKDLPTIMTSDMHCLSTMMKCIALGAVEFLKKPVSEEKLKNIWQHVVHKAFNAGGGQVDSESKLKIEPVETEKEVSIESETLRLQESEQDLLSHSDKFPAPSTPQIKQSGRFLDDVDYHDQTNSSTDKDNGEHEQDGETFKSVETTIDYSVVNAKDVDAQPPQRPTEAVVKEENHHCCVDGVGIPDGSQNVNNMSEQLHDKGGPMVIVGAIENPERETSSSIASGGSRSRAAANRKKAKVDWTHELHKKFVQAVEQLGLEQAIPSRILELMKVEGLTRHNVASHLQKYRMQRRHILPKDDERRWPQPRASLQRAYYARQAPVMAFPPYHPIHSYSASPFYPMWGQTTTNQLQNIKMWAPPGYPWNPMENWLWKPYSGLHADAWGCPVMPTPQCPRSTIPESSSTILGVHSHGNYGMPRNSADLQAGVSLGLGMEEEVIDKVVSEAISMPWLPLPIGLKPPSTESVLAELSKQGISTVPPNSINDRLHH